MRDSLAARKERRWAIVSQDIGIHNGHVAVAIIQGFLSAAGLHRPSLGLPCVYVYARGYWHTAGIAGRRIGAVRCSLRSKRTES